MRTIGIENPAPGEIRFWETGPVPDPGPTQIVIETFYSGMSPSLERNALLGQHAFAEQFPHRVGHQTVGRVFAAGGDVRLVVEGELVFFGQDLGHRGWHLVDVGPNNFLGAENHLVQPLTDDVEPEHCALLGAAAHALRAVTMFGVSPGDSLCVFGGDLIGQCVAQGVRAAGATVTVTDSDDVRLALAASCGAHRILDLRDEADRESLKDGGPYDFIMDTSDDRHLLHRIHQEGLLQDGGTIGLLSMRGEIALPCALLREHEAALRSVNHFDGEDVRVALQLLRQKSLNLGALINLRATIDDATEIYEQLRDPQHALMGVVFDWRSGTSDQPAYFESGSIV